MPPEHTTSETNPSTTHTTPVTATSNLGIPIAIVIAAAIIAGAIYMSGTKNTGSVGLGGTNIEQKAQVTPEVTVLPVTGDDHIRGNPNAPIMIVEYSDYDCPFCKNFHETMNEVMAKFGTDGKVAWVYRQFPLEQLHPNAPKISAASECVAELGGNEAFWKFSDLIFGGREINALTDMTKLSGFAMQSGVDKNKFDTCFNSGKYDEQIAEDVADAIAAGARGTPYSVVLVDDEQVGIINGAQPFEVVEKSISELITQLR